MEFSIIFFIFLNEGFPNRGILSFLVISTVIHSPVPVTIKTGMWTDKLNPYNLLRLDSNDVPVVRQGVVAVVAVQPALLHHHLPSRHYITHNFLCNNLRM